jgi:hypothetical protein
MSAGYGHELEWSTLSRLTPVAVMRDRLRAAMLDEGAVVLVPPDFLPDWVENWDGMTLLRVPGLPVPMIGLPGPKFPVAP